MGLETVSPFAGDKMKTRAPGFDVTRVRLGAGAACGADPWGWREQEIKKTRPEAKRTNAKFFMGDLLVLEEETYPIRKKDATF